ncbi:MAG TPA: DUF4382 domain-containing protein [Hanamia sp.]|jgi:hypothetical protein|nr:DUF4382 domain-containing protein [Hanamia sp.]
MKQKKVGILFPSLAIFALIFTFNACKKSDTTSSAPSSMNIYLTDAPADYQAVWIDVQQVMVKSSNDTSGTGWVSVPLLHPGKYNLLDFRNGKDTLLGGVDLPAGKISQIRLVLGESNQLVLNDGTSVDLKTPSGQESGIKLNVDADLKAGIPYELVLDFDAARSIVKAGNSGQYILKPVIRTFAKATGGAIAGVVLPDSANAHVIAIAGTDTLGAIPDASGAYKFWGVPAGNYSLTFSADSASGFKSASKNNIAVTVGNTTTVDTVRLVH